MTRRWFGLAATAYCLRADEGRDVWDAISTVISALSQNDVSIALAGFDPSMPGWEALENNIRALLAGWQVSASVELIRSEPGPDGCLVELDWLFHITERADTARATRRHQRVNCKLAPYRKRWRIVSFEPADLFAPPRQ